MREGQIRTFHILTSLDRRGAETFAVQMIDRLDRSRFSPTIWTARPPITAQPLIPLHTPVCSRVTTPQGGYAEIRGLVAAMNRVRPHLVQCHGGRALKDAVAAKPFWRAEAYVFNKIGSIHPGLDPWLKRLVYRFLLEEVDAIVAVGEQVRRELIEALHFRRPFVVTINNGRDVSPFLDLTPQLAACTRRELNLSADDTCLMAVGSLTREKNLSFLLDLCADLLPCQRTIRLLFVGDGPMRDELRSRADRLGLADRVSFLGVRPDVPRLLSAADIVLLPSLTEGLPGVLIEAGMAGRPAVAFRVGSVEDVLVDGFTGFVVPLGQGEVFTERVLTLIINPPLRLSMGHAAMQRCRRNFDIWDSVRLYEDLFSDLVGLASPRTLRAAAGPTGGDKAHGVGR